MSGYRDDSQDIRRALEDRIEAVLDDIAPGWVERKGVAYLTPKNAKDLGSFTVQLRDGKMPRGSFYRFSQGVGGGSVELVAYQLYGSKDRYREAFEWARRFLGMERAPQSAADRDEEKRRRAEAERARVEERQAREASLAAAREKKVLSAVEVWDGCRALVGSHGEAYLVARGLPPVAEWPWDPSDVLRFHPALHSELEPRAGTFPAIVARVQDCFGTTTAVWQIYLDRERPQKADLEHPKVGRGPAGGGAVRLGGEGEIIGVAEGVESALAAYALEDFRQPVWATLSTSGMRAFEPPIEVVDVRIWSDSDYGQINRKTGEVFDPPGISAARALRDRLVPSGIKCSIQDGCVHGDALDLLKTKREHEERTRTA